MTMVIIKVELLHLCMHKRPNTHTWRGNFIQTILKDLTYSLTKSSQLSKVVSHACLPCLPSRWVSLSVYLSTRYPGAAQKRPSWIELRKQTTFYWSYHQRRSQLSSFLLYHKEKFHTHTHTHTHRLTHTYTHTHTRTHARTQKLSACLWK